MREVFSNPAPLLCLFLSLRGGMAVYFVALFESFGMPFSGLVSYLSENLER